MSEHPPAPTTVATMPPGAVPTGDMPGSPVFAIHQIQSWQGQFPPPDAIERYEAVSAGTFDRLITMAERQQRAMIEATAEARRFQRGDNQRGQCLGALVTVLAIIGAGVCAWLGEPWVAGALVGVPVLAVAKALVDSARRAVPGAASTESSIQRAEANGEEPELPFA